MVPKDVVRFPARHTRPHQLYDHQRDVFLSEFGHWLAACVPPLDDAELEAEGIAATLRQMVLTEKARRGTPR